MHLRAVVQEERRRRAATAQALASIVRHQVGGKVSVEAIRHHLAEYYGRALAKACTWEEMWRAVRACRGKVSWSIVGGRRQRHFRGVELIRARGFHRLEKTVERRLSREGLEPEIGLIRRMARQFGDRDGASPEMQLAGTGADLYQGKDGVHRQVDNSELVQIQADTKNPTGRRGRRRRFVPYLARMEVYLQTARIPVEDRQILELVVEGLAVRAIAARLQVTKWKVQSTIERHQDAAAIPGPGPGC
jgi:hypothetical protein